MRILKMQELKLSVPRPLGDAPPSVLLSRAGAKPPHGQRQQRATLPFAVALNV